MVSQGPNTFYTLIHSSLWICEMLNRLVVLALIFDKNSYNYVTAFITYFIIEKSYNFVIRLNREPKEAFFRKILLDLMDLKNLESYYSHTKFFFLNHVQIAQRTAVHIILIQYLLIEEQELFLIESRITQSFVVFVIIVNFIQPAILNYLLCSTVNDFIMNTNYIQLPVLAIQSLGLLLMETYVLLSPSEYQWIYLLVKGIILIGTISILFKKNGQIGEYTQSHENIIAVALFSLISVPYNYYPFINYVSDSFCIREKQQFHNQFLQFGRYFQLAQFIIGVFLINKFRDDMTKIESIYFNEFSLVIFLLYFLLGLTYIISIVKCRFTNCYKYYYEHEVDIGKLMKVINNKKDLLYLEVQSIQNINFVEGQQVHNKFAISENLKSNITKEQRQAIFDLLFFEPLDRNFKIYIGTLIQIYQSQTAYYSYPFFEMMVDAIENRVYLPNRYYINKDYISHEQRQRYFHSIINRMFIYGYTPQITNLAKTQQFNQNALKAITNFQSQVLQAAVFFREFPTIIPMNPNQLFYDLFDVI